MPRRYLNVASTPDGVLRTNGCGLVFCVSNVHKYLFSSLCVCVSLAGNFFEFYLVLVQGCEISGGVAEWQSSSFVSFWSLGVGAVVCRHRCGLRSRLTDIRRQGRCTSMRRHRKVSVKTSPSMSTKETPPSLVTTEQQETFIMAADTPKSDAGDTPRYVTSATMLLLSCQAMLKRCDRSGRFHSVHMSENLATASRASWAQSASG